MKAKVISFDKTRGQGYVRLQDNELGVIYACNIKGKRTWYAETACVFYDVGQEFEYEIKHDRFVCGLTDGKFDSNKWDSLDQDNLAFKCNDEGKATCGLFKGAK